MFDWRRLTTAFAILLSLSCGSEDGRQESPAPDAGAAASDGGGAGAPDAGGATPDAGAPSGAPISAPAGTWTWVDFPDSSCDDGSPTGIGVNLSSTSSNVLIYFNGGGACWSQQTCLFLNTAAHGPFGKAQFDTLIGSVGGSILDRGLPQSPVADWNLVFVPYCTGDVHGGDNVVVYGTTTYHHVGHANVLAYLERLTATFPAPAKLVVSGSSAGGFGAMLNHDTLRARWPGARAYLIDDGGPPLMGDAIPAATRTAWYEQWKLGALLDPLCGTACEADLSQALVALAARYPNDRVSLLSSLQDSVIRSYFQQTPEGFQAALLSLSAAVFDPTPNLRYFLIPGTHHVFLDDPSGVSQSGVVLTDWLGRQIADDAAWASVKP